MADSIGESWAAAVMKPAEYAEARRSSPGSITARSAICLALILCTCSVTLAQEPGVADPGSPQNVTWTLGRPPERVRLPANQQVEFTVSAGGEEVKDVRLAESTLQDAVTFLRLDASQLSLYAGDDPPGAPINVPANTTRRLTLKISPRFKAPGVFTGEVSFRIAANPETQSFKLTVYSRSVWRMLLGLLVMAIGLGLYFFVNVWLRGRIATEQALLPACELADTLAALQRKLDDARALTSVAFAALDGEIRKLENELKLLAGKLHPAIDPPWPSAKDWVADFRARLSQLADRTGALVVLVKIGVVGALAYWGTTRDEVKTALEKIDALATTATTADVAQAQVAIILKELRDKPASRRAASLEERTPPLDTHTLRVQLMRTTVLVWGLIAFVALIGGYYSVVYQNFGFGTFADYIKCFFWGLGFSVAGTQLEQLTQSSVAGGFGISIPKA